MTKLSGAAVVGAGADGEVAGVVAGAGVGVMLGAASSPPRQDERSPNTSVEIITVLMESLVAVMVVMATAWLGRVFVLRWLACRFSMRPAARGIKGRRSRPMWLSGPYGARGEPEPGSRALPASNPQQDMDSALAVMAIVSSWEAGG